MRKPDASAGNPAQNERWGKMTNGEEYKKAEESTSAFNYYCEGQDTDCKGCPLSGNKRLYVGMLGSNLKQKPRKRNRCRVCSEEVSVS